MAETYGLSYSRAHLDRSSLDADGPMLFTVSSQVLNRHGFSLRTDGWRLDNWNANPAVLWQHNDFMPPIGRGQAFAKDDRTVAEVTFDREDELGRRIESKYRRGFLSAVSAGLHFVDESGQTLDPWRLTDQQVRDEAFYDLAEVSAVSVPADPSALVQRQRFALAQLSGTLGELADEREFGTITKTELQAAVREELERLGIDWQQLAAVGTHSTEVREGEWDANANLSRMDWPVPRSVANRVAAVVRDGEVTDEGVPREAVALPHHFVGSDGMPGAASVNGINNALAQLPKTQGLSDAERAGAERHLRAHLPDGDDGDDGRSENAAPGGITTEQIESLKAAFTLERITS